MLTNKIPFQIASGKTTSAFLPIAGFLPVGLYIDPGMTSTTVTFASATGANGNPSTISDGAGGSYTRTFAAGNYVPLDPATFSGVDFLEVIFGSSEGAARNCVLITTAPGQ